MAGNADRRKTRGNTPTLDGIQIMVGIVVVFMTVAAFLRPEQYIAFFPIVFTLEALMNLITGNFKRTQEGGDRRRKAAGLVQMAGGGLFAVLAVMSAVSIWMR